MRLRLSFLSMLLCCPIVFGDEHNIHPLKDYPVNLGFSASQTFLGGGIFNAPSEAQYPMDFEFIDQRKKDELQCPGGIHNPSSMGFTLILPDGIFTGSARFKDGRLSEFGGIKTDRRFTQTRYITLSGADGIETSKKSPPPLAPVAGSRVGEPNSTSIQVFMNTDMKSADAGRIKSYQYRFEKQPNVHADFSKKEPLLSDVYYGSMTTVAALLSSYQKCCPNEAMEPCLKKIKSGVLKKLEENTEKNIEKNIEKKPKTKPPSFKDSSPFSPVK